MANIININNVLIIMCSNINVIIINNNINNIMK